MRVHWKLFLAEKKKKHCSSSRTHREKPHCDPPSLVWGDIFFKPAPKAPETFYCFSISPSSAEIKSSLGDVDAACAFPLPPPVPAFILLTRKQSIDLFWLLLKICSKKNYSFFLVGRGQKQRRWLNHFRPTKEQIWHCFTAEGWRVFFGYRFYDHISKKIFLLLCWLSLLPAMPCFLRYSKFHQKNTCTFFIQSEKSIGRDAHRFFLILHQEFWF